MHSIAVSELARGEKGVVLGFENDRLGQRLISMGMLPGKEIELVRAAPFFGAYYLKVDRQRIVVRAEEAKAIMIKRSSVQ